LVGHPVKNEEIIKEIEDSDNLKDFTDKIMKSSLYQQNVEKIG